MPWPNLKFSFFFLPFVFYNGRAQEVGLSHETRELGNGKGWVGGEASFSQSWEEGATQTLSRGGGEEGEEEDYDDGKKEKKGSFPKKANNGTGQKQLSKW